MMLLPPHYLPLSLPAPRAQLGRLTVGSTGRRFLHKGKAGLLYIKRLSAQKRSYLTKIIFRRGRVAPGFSLNSVFRNRFHDACGETVRGDRLSAGALPCQNFLIVGS